MSGNKQMEKVRRMRCSVCCQAKENFSVFEWTADPNCRRCMDCAPETAQNSSPADIPAAGNYPRGVSLWQSDSAGNIVAPVPVFPNVGTGSPPRGST